MRTGIVGAVNHATVNCNNRNWVERADGTRVALSGTDIIEMGRGDVFVIETPSGGGYGKPAE